MLPLSEIKLIGYALAVAAVLGAVWAFIAHERGIGEAKAVAAQAQADAKEYQRRVVVQQENLHEANLYAQQVVAGSRDLDRTVASLHERYAPKRATAAAASVPGHAESVPSADMVPPDVYLRAVDAATELARAVDCLRGVSELCVKDYGALTP